MKNLLIIFICLSLPFYSAGQAEKKQFVGINFLQLPALTLNLNYIFELKPYLTPQFDIGYAFNYEKSFDIAGNLLTPHCKCGNDGYDVENLTGAYLKVGTFLNLRNSFEKQNFFHLGVFFNNSFVSESAVYQPMSETEHDKQSLKHTIYVPGLSYSVGYEFSIFKNLKSNIDFQISLPGKNYEDLYGYRNYIPGMGYKDFEGYWFPMLIWNVKYSI